VTPRDAREPHRSRNCLRSDKAQVVRAVGPYWPNHINHGASQRQQIFFSLTARSSSATLQVGLDESKIEERKQD